MIKLTLDGVNAGVGSGQAVNNQTGQTMKALQVVLTDPLSGIQVECTWVGEAADKFAAEIQAAVSGIVIARPGMSGMNGSGA